MHDCPGCRVPLHGYEEVCPSCGTKQTVRKGGGGASRMAGGFKTAEPGINWTPFVIAIVAVGIVILCSIPGSWIGKLVTEGPPKEDPMDKITYMDARNFIETEITKGLTAVGAQGKFKWADPAGTEVDRGADQQLQLTIETKLPEPSMRKQIIDPVKEYMEKAKIPTLVMTDSKSRATWTYNVQPGIAPANPEQ